MYMHLPIVYVAIDSAYSTTTMYMNMYMYIHVHMYLFAVAYRLITGYRMMGGANCEVANQWEGVNRN